MSLEQHVSLIRKKAKSKERAVKFLYEFIEGELPRLSAAFEIQEVDQWVLMDTLYAELLNLINDLGRKATQTIGGIVIYKKIWDSIQNPATRLWWAKYIPLVSLEEQKKKYAEEQWISYDDPKVQHKMEITEFPYTLEITPAGEAFLNEYLRVQWLDTIEAIKAEKINFLTRILS